PNEGTADAEAVHHELVDAEMIQQTDVVVGIGIPGTISLERTRGLPTPCVAEISGDDAILAAELVKRIVRRLLAGETRDGRIQAAARDHQQRITRSLLFIVDADGTSLVKAHGGSSLCLRQHLRCCGHRGCGYTRGQYVASCRIYHGRPPHNPHGEE